MKGSTFAQCAEKLSNDRIICKSHPKGFLLNSNVYLIIKHDLVGLTYIWWTFVFSNGHMLTHRNKKPYECKAEGCGKSYCDARSLRRHTENHHSSSTVNATTMSPAQGAASGDAASPHGSSCIQYAPPPTSTSSSSSSSSSGKSQLQQLLATEPAKVSHFSNITII